MISAVRWKATRLCHSTLSCQSPRPSLKDSFVASERLTTIPLRRLCTSGSFPTLPTNRTLLTLLDIVVLLVSNQSLDIVKGPIAVNLDVAAIDIAVEAPRDSIDVQIPAGVPMLVQHQVAGVAHIHEVLTQG